MKVLHLSDDPIKVLFDNNEEKTLYEVIKNAIEKYVPKVKRKAYSNWTFVSDLTYHGSGYSIAICKALGVDPYGHIWEKEQNNEL